MTWSFTSLTPQTATTPEPEVPTASSSVTHWSHSRPGAEDLNAWTLNPDYWTGSDPRVTGESDVIGEYGELVSRITVAAVDPPVTVWTDVGTSYPTFALDGLSFAAGDLVRLTMTLLYELDFTNITGGEAASNPSISDDPVMWQTGVQMALYFAMFDQPDFNFYFDADYMVAISDPGGRSRGVYSGVLTSTSVTFRALTDRDDYAVICQGYVFTSSACHIDLHAATIEVL